jgi:rod shape-determining protein MreD
VFWNIHQHRYVGVIWAFSLGLLIDVHNSDLLGLHAFSYALVAYIAISWHRRIVALAVLSQALHLLPIFLLVSLFPVLAHWVLSGDIYWWALTGTIQAIIEAMLWPLATRILLAPQRRPIDVDPNRPL